MRIERGYQITLLTLDPLRVGGREDPLVAEHNLVVTLDDKVAIPGSTLKGALRAKIEQYLIESYYDAASRRWPADRSGFQPCLATTKPSVDERRLIDEGRYSSQATCSYKSPEQVTRDMPANRICPACYLLGAQGLVGFVRVPFLLSERRAEELYASRIDRATGTVSKGANRPYQLVPHNTTFKGTLYVLLNDDILSWQIGKPRPLKNATDGDRWLRDDPSWTQDRIIKELLIDRLQAIETLGGYKSKGFGRVKITVEPLQ